MIEAGTQVVVDRTGGDDERRETVPSKGTRPSGSNVKTSSAGASSAAIDPRSAIFISSSGRLEGLEIVRYYFLSLHVEQIEGSR